MRIEWTGRELRVADAAVDRLALDLSGHFFDEAAQAANGEFRFRFPYAPAGVPRLELMLRAGRDGECLLAAPQRVWMGHAGLPDEPAPMASADELLLSSDGDWLVPYGLDVMKPHVAVVMPIYNAPEAVATSIESVLANIDAAARLFLIDDASTDPAIEPLLARYRGRHGVTVLRNEHNRGFTATANRGIRAAGRADVVLLNADTRVSRHWLTGLRRAALSRPDIGSVTAVSDNAGAFSVPELERDNHWPDGWQFDDAARALWHDAGLAYPVLPTGNGFCMYVRRAVLDQVGLLDEEAFPQGYGEENDWCQRAEAAGFVHVIAGNVLVHHLRTQSFGVERRAALGEQGMAVLRERWPGYENAVGATLYSYQRRVLDWRVRRIWASSVPLPQRILHLLDAQPSNLSQAGQWAACIDDGDVVLRCPLQGGWHEVDRVPAQQPEVAASGLPHRQAIWTWLQRHGFDAVAIDAPLAHPQETRSLASMLGVPVIRN